MILIDLVAGQLSAFAGLGALRHLDLHHVGIDEIFRRDAKAARRDLLDRRAHGIAVRHRLEAVGFLAAFAGIRLAADAVHRDRERGMRLARDRAERHRAGREAPHDVLGGLDLVERHRLAAVFFRALDAEQAADGDELLGLLVQHFARIRGSAHRNCRARRAAGPRPSPRSRHDPRRGCGTDIRRRHRARSCRPANRRRRRDAG